MAAQEVSQGQSMNKMRLQDIARIAETVTGNAMVYYTLYRLLDMLEFVLNWLLTNIKISV